MRAALGQSGLTSLVKVGPSSSLFAMHSSTLSVGSGKLRSGSKYHHQGHGSECIYCRSSFALAPAVVGSAAGDSNHSHSGSGSGSGSFSKAGQRITIRVMVQNPQLAKFCTRRIS